MQTQDKITLTTDVWCLGLLLYEMCSLRHPFQGQYADKLLMNIKNAKVKPLTENYSEGVNNLLKSLLDPNPKTRPTIS